MTEIFATLGPACREKEILREMFKRGMDGMRLNLSHTTLKESADLLKTYHQAAAEAGKQAELLIDLQGPELRTAKPAVPVILAEGEKAVFASEPGKGIVLPETVFNALETGDILLIDDGTIECRIETKEDDAVAALVVRGGTLNARKSVKVIGKDLAGPLLTEEDMENIRHMKEYGVTAVMQPFVTDGAQLAQLRQILDDNGGSDVRIFAKIENRRGIEALSSITEHADMIVIARGDLGNDMPLWQLPRAQKEIEDVCLARGVPFLVVTQMLASMIHSPLPTRAEVSDIFRAVTEGASALMVTNETAVGEYPAEVIRYLKNTSLSAEEYMRK